MRGTIKQWNAGRKEHGNPERFDLSDRRANMGTKTEPEPLGEWIVLIPDIEGTLETRMKVRE